MHLTNQPSSLQEGAYVRIIYLRQLRVGDDDSITDSKVSPKITEGVDWMRPTQGSGVLSLWGGFLSMSCSWFMPKKI